jgi:hypothetical protein
MQTKPKLNYKNNYTGYTIAVLCIKPKNLPSASQVMALIIRQFCDLCLMRGHTRLARDTLQGPGVCGNAMRSALGIHNPGRNIEVVEAIAGLMVTLIVSNARLAVPPVTKKKSVLGL